MSWRPAGRKSRARQRRRPRHRPRHRAEARRGGLRRRGQLLQQRRGGRNPLRRDPRARAGARSRSRAAWASPIRVDEIVRRIRQAFRPPRHPGQQRGVGRAEADVEMTLKHWRWCMETNALALNLLTQRGLPLMPSGARIIAHVEPRRAARDARLRLHRRVEGRAGVARPLARAGARAPGHPRQHRSAPASSTPTRSPTSRTAKSCSRTSRERTPAGPVLTPEDVAGAVYLLCLPEAAMINGHTLVVDGGFAISG